MDLALRRNDDQAVIDLKLQNGKWRRSELAEGRGLQLAMYSTGLGRGAPTAYFILREARALTLDGRAFPGADVVDGPSSIETMRDAEEGWRWWRELLDQGRAYAPPLMSMEDWEEAAAAAAAPQPVDGPAGKRGECVYCDYKALCLLGGEG